MGQLLNLFGRGVQLTRRLRGDLDAAGLFEIEHHDEGLGDRPAPGQKPVVAQDQQLAPVAQIGQQARLFFRVEGQPLKLMIADQVPVEQRGLADRQKPLGLRRDARPGRGVGVDDAGQIVAFAVNAGMDHVSRRVDRRRLGIDRGAIQVHLDQRRGRDLLVERAEGVEQEMRLGPRDAGRNVVVDQVVHAEMRDQPVGGGQVDPGLPFIGRHADGGRRDGVGHVRTPCFLYEDRRGRLWPARPFRHMVGK